MGEAPKYPVRTLEKSIEILNLLAQLQSLLMKRSVLYWYR